MVAHLFGDESLVVCLVRIDLILEVNHSLLPLIELMSKIL